MKIDKNIKNLLVGLFLGVLISGVVTVSAISYCKASEVSYTPTDVSFQASTVNDALNKLYSRSNYLDEINTNESSYGTINVTKDTQTINVGFKPSKILIYVIAGNNIHTYLYDSRVSTNQVLLSWNVPTVSSGCGYYVMQDQGFSITDQGFSLKAVNSYQESYAYWYAMK